MMVGRLLSFWEGNFSRAMLNFRWVSLWIWILVKDLFTVLYGHMVPPFGTFPGVSVLICWQSCLIVSVSMAPFDSEKTQPAEGRISLPYTFRAFSPEPPVLRGSCTEPIIRSYQGASSMFFFFPKWGLARINQHVRVLWRLLCQIP